jgi:hypothetical protein
MNDQQQRVLVSVRGGGGGLGLKVDCAFWVLTDTQGLGIDVCNLLSFVSSTLTRVQFACSCSSPHQKYMASWRIRVGAAHGMFSSLRDDFGLGLSVLQR